MPVDRAVLRAAARRIATIYVTIVLVTLVGSLLLGLLADADLGRSIAVGFYIAGAILLIGCFVTGVRGPLRGVSRGGETVSVLGARGVRKATADERSEATRTSVLLFAMGMSLVVIGAIVDPAHTVF